MRNHWLAKKLFVPFSSLLLAWILFPRSARAQIPGDWWPDPATHRGLSVWVNFSRQYDEIYRDLDLDPKHDQLVEQELANLTREGIDVVFLFFSSSIDTPHLQTLSIREDSFTRDVQSLLNRLNLPGREIRACAAILSNNFTGTPGQLDRFTLVDHLLNFNRNRDPSDAAFRCVATDVEMPARSRSTTVYDLWKQFYLNMKNRIAESGSDLPLLAWVQGPDFLIARMDDAADRDALMERENIAPLPDDPALFTGAIRYFTTQSGVSIFDAVIPMWFFTPPGPYMRRVEHNFDELQSITGDRPFLIAGMMIRNEVEGLCCSGCIAGRADYVSRLEFNDAFRGSPPLFIGTGVFKWPISEDWTCTASAGSASGDTIACEAQ